jgi:hypothetical protein
MVSFMQRPLTLRERVLDIHWIGGWMGPKIRLDDVGNRKISPVLDLELRPLGHPASIQSLYQLFFTLFPNLLGASIAKGYRLAGRGSIRGKGERFFCSSQRQDWL